MHSLFWIVIAAVFAIIEGLTVSLVSIWFVGGALVASLAAYLGASILIQSFVFFGVSLVLIAITRPLVKMRIEKKTQDFNSDIGKVGVVSKEISKDSPGEIKIDEKIWRAKSEETIHSGEKVKIVDIVGVTAIVRRNA